MERRVHFGDWLRRQIEGQQLTQKQFAHLAGIPLPTLKSWIAQPRPPLLGRSIVRLSRALGSSRRAVESKLGVEPMRAVS